MHSPHNSSNLAFLEDCLSRWSRGGRQESPETLCAKRPELIPELASQIRAIKDSESVLRDAYEEAAIEKTCLALGLMELPPKTLSPKERLISMTQLITDSQFGDRYKIDKEIGEGGYGHVYLAHDIRMDRPVAIKALCSLLPKDYNIEQEARFQANVKSPYVVTIYDALQLKNNSMISVMEFVEQGSMQQIMNKSHGRIEEATAVGWMKNVARGMIAAEKVNIVHRDLKPGNILIDHEGVAKIADFGLAIRPSTLLATSVSAGIGTPSYMSPEQIETPHSVDTRSDIYSFGATFYRAVVGEVPFHGESTKIIFNKHKTEIPVPAAKVVSSLSTELSDLLQKCLAKSPCERYQSFVEVLEALDKLPDTSQNAKNNQKSTDATTQHIAVRNLGSSISYVNTWSDLAASNPEDTIKSPSHFANQRLWIYKCNAKEGVRGNWDYFFDNVIDELDWGSTRDDSIKSNASRKILRQEMQVGDLILAWQSDMKVAIGLCRVAELENDGDDVTILLETVNRFKKPVNLLEWKKKYPALRDGIGFQQGSAGTIHATTAPEAAAILKICGVKT